MARYSTSTNLKHHHQILTMSSNDQCTTYTSLDFNYIIQLNRN
ncbi:hypothetical protein MtrunA17_Chr5g0437881 [Medicago truncatula]|uniref:Uncharacterized protein n=1 Tax=Medicago truncatula TaxID=3880 RepID=A0A396I2W7_MEDTR|nr:hypothetical protein MtrunA17_Chr5g0437881 [Medicago truncatula]